jgi:hypothetical protein
MGLNVKEGRVTHLKEKVGANSMKFNKQIFTILILALLVPLAASASTHDIAKEKHANPVFTNIMPNPVTSWNKHPTNPVIDRTAFVHPMSSVIGAVSIGAHVMVSPFASIRGDEGMPISLEMTAMSRTES